LQILPFQFQRLGRQNRAIFKQSRDAG